MPNQGDQSIRVTRWRRKAEEKIRESTYDPSAISVPRSVEEAQRLIYELQVHQIELEMQNEELQKAQNELHSARTCYFNLYDLTPVGYVTVDHEGLILKINLAAATILGRVREDLIGQTIYQTIYPEDQDIFYLCRKKLLKSSELQECELRMVKKNGAPLWVSLSCSTAQFESDVVSFLIVLSDITDRKNSEEALDKIRIHLRAALENMSDAVFISDAEGKITEFNTSFASFHKFKSKDECYDYLHEWQKLLDVYLPDGSLIPLNF